MQGTTRRWVDQPGWLGLHALAVVSLLGLALLGQVPGEIGGWVVRPAVPGVAGAVGQAARPGACGGGCWQALACYLVRSWWPVALRGLWVWGLWEWSGRWGPGWLRLVPWALWLWRGLGVGWPRLRQWVLWQAINEGLWQGQRWLLVGYLAVAVSGRCGVLGALGCLVGGVTSGDEASEREGWVQVVRQADGSYQAELCGHFRLTVAGDHPFRMRLLVLFLSLLDVPGMTRGSRRTRDGRQPFVRQMQMAEWFGVPQPDLSRWLCYWHAGRWADLLSLHSAEVLTSELVAQIVEVFATCPTWSAEQVHQHLRQRGVTVTLPQVLQAAEQSGWRRLRESLLARYEMSGAVLQVRDAWLVGQLLGQVRELLGRLEEGGGATAEEQGAVADLTAMAANCGVVSPPPLKALPWLLRLEQVVFGQWEMLPDGQVRCPYCGSDQVGRKSAQPRGKKYYDEAGQIQQVAVYRYYCHNPQCAKGSFTDLPPGLVPYSPYRTEMHLLALQMYAWGYSTYRRTGAALGVASLTVWRWVSAWGYDLLPVAALFGVVRSSGVVGVDEKYVLVPKNDKPAGEMRRWMYVYFAVDVWTYDLLHIAMYAHNTPDSAQAFLVALRAKGYHPQVLITDLRQDYGPVIAQVFPQAIHHLCVFHALQDVQKHIRDVYGPDYADKDPPAERLKRQIYALFAADTLALAAERYTAVLALRQDYVQTRPEATRIFDFLERHWPQLANSIGSSTIPATNNTVELVIRRFDQHYQTFGGFESLADAQRYLAVFEKLYRFTPFSPDAQPRIRGQSPLQLAGYDLTGLPMATLCAGLSILWPMQTSEANHVPNQLR